MASIRAKNFSSVQSSGFRGISSAETACGIPRSAMTVRAKRAFLQLRQQAGRLLAADSPLWLSSKGSKKGGRILPAPPEMESVNRKNALSKLRWTINANFVPGDYWITLTYFAQDWPTLERALDDYRKFMRELRKVYARHGIPLKYVSVTERRRATKGAAFA